MTAYFGRVEERRLAELGRQLVDKLRGRGGPLAVTIGRFLRNHGEGADELATDKLVKALQGQLPGVSDKELEALADRFDTDGSQTVSIKEMQGALSSLTKGEALPEARSNPAPEIIVESDTEEDWLGASQVRVQEMRRSRELVTSPKSPLYSPGTRAPPGPEGFDDRLDNFLAKLSGRVAALATEAHARLPPQQRLPARADALLRALGQRKLREALDEARQSDQHKLTPGQLYDALKVFRTPGQDLLHDRDARRLWDLCNSGDPKVFLKLFRDHELAGSEGRSLRSGAKKANWQATHGAGSGPSLPKGKSVRRDTSDARTYPHAGDVNDAAAGAEALRLRYKTSRTLVQPPIGWRKPELTKAVKRSSKPPQKALALERCFGFQSDAPGPNLCLCVSQHKLSIVYLSAACAVVQDLEEKTQKVFRGHTDDATCVCTDRTGSLGASGQCASTEMQPYVCVWDVNTCQELRRFGGDGSIARMACAISFFDDASHVAVVGGDDRHTLRVYDLNPPLSITGDDAVIVAPCKAGVEPPAVTGLYAAPKDSAHRFGNDHVLVSVGKGHLAFWKIDLPRKGGSYNFSKRLPTYRPHKAPQATHCVAFVPLDDAVVTGVSDGRAFVWRDFRIAHVFQAHALQKPCRALVHARGHLFTGGGDGLVKRWRLDKGRYEQCNEFRPVSPHDFGRKSGAMRDVENAFPGSASIANVGSNGLKPVQPKVRKQHKAHTMLSGFESQRSSGFTGVVDLLLHPMDDNHVVIGTGFCQVLVVDLPDGPGKKPRSELHVAGHHNSVQGLACHSSKNLFATVGLDCLLILWDATQPIPLHVKSLRAGATAVCIRGPHKNHHHTHHASLEEHLCVGYNDGEVEIFAFPSLEKRWHPERRADPEAISCAKYSPSGRLLAVGSHDNAIYLMDASQNYRVRRKLNGHSSYVKNIDWSFDSDLLQSSCGAYEIMYWDVAAGKRYRGAQDSVESDTRWQDWSLTLGFPVMGINADASDGTDVNAVCRTKDESLVLCADDSGHVRLFNAPVACRFAAHRAYLGHSSHCLGVGFLPSQTLAASCGGRDAAVLLWRVVDGGEDSQGETINKPQSARPAWHEGCDITSTTDILRRARPLAGSRGDVRACRVRG